MIGARTITLAAAALGNSICLGNPVDLSPEIQKTLARFDALPSMAAAVVVGDETVAQGAAGIRKRGDKTEVTLADRYHIGSCTKMMTATLAAVLVEDGLLDWDTTISEALGKKIAKIHPDFEDVTLEQLLAHVGGFPQKAPETPWRQAWKDQGKISPTKQRLAYTKALLQAPATYPPGTESLYSNQGYAVAGVMLETLARRPWEKLMRERIFGPLDMKSAGFRAPAGRRPVDEPWGHSGGNPVPPESGDNPDAIGPAGTVHVSVTDWAKFARFHLERTPGTLLRKPSSFDRLHTVLPESGQHSVGGWLALEGKRFGGSYVHMNGSNTMWYARFWILPAKNIAVVVATNTAHDDASKACGEIFSELAARFSGSP